MRALRQAADPDFARRSAAYFKKDDVFATLGVRAADVRSVARSIGNRARDSWGFAEALAFCERMSRRSHHEAKAVGVLVLGRFRDEFPTDLLSRARSWIEEGRFGNWAAIDLLCPEVLTPLVERNQRLVRTVRGWTKAKRLWLRRAAAVTFVPLARRGERLDDVYDVACRLRAEKEDLVQKACGWLLREAGRTDRARLRRFLIARGAEFPRTTLRYAIERFPELERRELLRHTRGR
jgi:3-methyladenine DNA glycosylase AlkD